MSTALRSPPDVDYNSEEMSIAGYMTTEQAAQELGVTPSAIRQHLRRGNIEGTKIGGTWFIPVEELDKIRDAKPGRPPKTEG